VREELYRILGEARGEDDPLGREPHGALSRRLSADDRLFAVGRGRAVAFRFRSQDGPAGSSITFALAAHDRASGKGSGG
jgi:hypothetical protein